MKSRGTKLSKHYQQTFDYWLNLVPHRPPYVVLCNFEELWIYDFNTQLSDPVDRVPAADLPARHFTQINASCMTALLVLSFSRETGKSAFGNGRRKLLGCPAPGDIARKRRAGVFGPR